MIGDDGLRVPTPPAPVTLTCPDAVATAGFRVATRVATTPRSGAPVPTCPDSGMALSCGDGRKWTRLDPSTRSCNQRVEQQGAVSLPGGGAHERKLLGPAYAQAGPGACGHG